MYKITETQFDELPKELQDLYEKLPNHSREEVVELFPSHKPHKMVRNRTAGARPFNNNGEGTGYKTVGSIDDPGGSAARFFYCAKASKKDRDEGLEGFEEKEYGKEHYSTARLNDLRMEGEQQRLPNKNNHPTVKPTALMRYLVKLVTPPGGTVLDPFTGSGSTGKACKLEGFDFIGIEREEEYVKIAEARIKAVPDTLL